MYVDNLLLRHAGVPRHKGKIGAAEAAVQNGQLDQPAGLHLRAVEAGAKAFEQGNELCGGQNRRVVLHGQRAVSGHQFAHAGQGGFIQHTAQRGDAGVGFGADVLPQLNGQGAVAAG